MADTRSSTRSLPGSGAAVGVLAAALVLVAGLAWAKWLPYTDKVHQLSLTGTWDGGSLLAESGTAGAAPSWSGAWDFTVTYGATVWKALVVALLLAAAVDALVPRRWLLSALAPRGPVVQSLSGALVALPSMMCTCCTAPVAVSLRRCGVPPAGALAYWVGNPMLNPAVLAFLFLVAPWQWGVVRLLVGAVVVVGASAAVGALAGGRRPAPAAPAAQTPVPDPRPAELPARFGRSLLRLGLVLVPEYFVVVLLMGALSGWLSQFAGMEARLGVLAVVAAAVVGTLLVLPTGGEIPVLVALAGLGVGAGTLGALLVTLPALSLPSAVMVARALSVRVTAAMAGAVAVGGLLGGVLLTSLV